MGGFEDDERDALLGMFGERASSHPRTIEAVSAADIEQGVVRDMASGPPPSAALDGKSCFLVHA